MSDHVEQATAAPGEIRRLKWDAKRDARRSANAEKALADLPDDLVIMNELVINWDENDQAIVTVDGVVQ